MSLMAQRMLSTFFSGANSGGHLLRQSSWRLLGYRYEWFPLFDDVGRELRRVNGADVLRRVRHSVRDQQYVARLQHYRRLALELVLQRAFEDIDDCWSANTE